MSRFLFSIAKPSAHFYTKIVLSLNTVNRLSPMIPQQNFLDVCMTRLKSYFLGLLLIIGLGVVLYQHEPFIKTMVDSACTITSIFGTKTKAPSEQWITVFVHGSFGSVLSFLSMSQVLHDDLKGSLYRKLNKKMRKNKLFYQDQPMLDKGFSKVNPTFEITSTTSNQAAYPIIKAYELVLRETHPKKEINHFYTFGWSGLMSQYRRRYESIRLYNHLTEEIEKFERQGIHPKIRLIAHSHGGNVCLNLAAIKKILVTKDPLESHNFSENPDENESIQKMFNILSQFPNKDAATLKKGQKRYNYVPNNPYLLIDELIIFGTPIQAETAPFVLSDIFNKIYNIYSEEDLIQQLDVLTTKGYAVNQRIKPEILNLVRDKNKITQVKIMYGRTFNTSQPAQEISKIDRQQKIEPESFWSKLLSLGISFSKKNDDPNHKELWFITWKDKECENDFCIAPLPTVIFTSTILTLLKNNDYNDVDINLTPEKNILKLQLLKHNQTLIEKTSSLPLKLIKSIKKNIEKWKPSDLSGTSEFDAISQHLI